MKAGAPMVNDVVKVGIIVLGGLALALAVIWYVHFCYQEIRGTGQIMIDPLTVVDDAGKSNEEVGKALAFMLQSRVESLTSELRHAQVGLTASSTTPKAADPLLADVRFWTQDVVLQTSLLQPVEMKLSVAGVDVGGIIPWLQRSLSSRRTLHFTVYSRGDEAQVFGAISPLGLPGAEIRLILKGAGGRAPSLDLIVDRLAHEIIRRWLAKNPSNRLELLRPAEFVSLAGIFVNAAEINRRAALGRPSQSEFESLLPAISALSDDVPDWPQLDYFVGWIADKARVKSTAASYYRRVISKLGAAKDDGLVALITERIASLEELASSGGVEVPEVIQPALNYTSKIKRVRDSGQEGSVVGQALATALEFQVAKSTQHEHWMSARYIYYAARKRAGGTDQDYGARLKDAIDVLAKEGSVEEDVWPYVPGRYMQKPPPNVETARRFRIADAKPLKTLNDVKRALARNGPVVASIEMYSSAMNAPSSNTGLLPVPAAKEQLIGYHAIVIVGYDDADQRVKFANSWGAEWGDHGYGYLPYEYLNRHMDDAWTFKLATP
jgi:hypothetical protein